MIFKADEIRDKFNNQYPRIKKDNTWVLIRPTGYQGIIRWKYRIKDAISVLRGKADIITWYKQ